MMVPMPRLCRFSSCGFSVCRLGLATRGNTSLDKGDVLYALERGVNYWNWCGHEDGMSKAIRELGPRRNQVVIAIQLSAREHREARRELDEVLIQLKTDYVDIVTFYYVETEKEWAQIIGPQGSLGSMEQARSEGRLKMIGLTTHQRSLAQRILASRRLDLLMVRYNAAHRGAEKDLLPLAQQLEVPLVSFTGLRWKALLSGTREDPEGFTPPPAREWYRFVLAHPAISVVLMAPGGKRELLGNLELLTDWRAPTQLEYEALKLHGDRVRRHAGSFS
jgi:predicted aldo/keto reductase-like oxidoreductase